MAPDSLVSITAIFGTRRYMNKFFLSFLQMFRYTLAFTSAVVFVLILVENGGFGLALVSLVSGSLVLAGIKHYMDSK